MLDFNSAVEPNVYKWHIVDNMVCLETIDGTYMLNESGSAIWKLLNGYRTIQEIASLMMENETKDSLQEVTEAVVEFIQQLEENKFVIINNELMEEDW